MQVKCATVTLCPKASPDLTAARGVPECLGGDARRSLVPADFCDMMLRGSRTFKEFLESYEGIASNILADRLRKLGSYGIISTQPDSSDGRKSIYVLTKKGIDLFSPRSSPKWFSGPPPTKKPAINPLVHQMKKDKKQFLAAVRERWQQSASVQAPTNATTISANPVIPNGVRGVRNLPLMLSFSQPNLPSCLTVSLSSYNMLLYEKSRGHFNIILRPEPEGALRSLCPPSPAALPMETHFGRGQENGTGRYLRLSREPEKTQRADSDGQRIAGGFA